jgi:hypothetical protein
VQKIQNNWTDFLEHPTRVRRLFPPNASPALVDVRFERLLIKTPREIVLGVRFFPLIPETMQPWIDKGLACVDLRILMADATLNSIDGSALDEQPKGDVEIGASELKFMCNGTPVIRIVYERLGARFMPEIWQNDQDMFGTTIEA